MTSITRLSSQTLFDQITKGQEEIARQKREVANAQIQTPKMLSGDSTWAALQESVNHLVKVAPEDHDVLLIVQGVRVISARFIEPHAFLFEGYGNDGLKTGLVCHFSQIVAHVVYTPKQGPERVITGFGNTSCQ